MTGQNQHRFQKREPEDVPVQCNDDVEGGEAAEVIAAQAGEG